MPNASTSFFGWVYFLLQKYGMLFLRGTGMTLLIALTGTALGFVLGLLVAIVRTITLPEKKRGESGMGLTIRRGLLAFVQLLTNIYIQVFRGTPMIVQMLIMGSIIFASSRNFTIIGTIALGINSGAYVAEIIRGGLMSLDPGQAEAGRSLGLNYFQTMRFIVIPQAFKAILPALGNEFITLFKDTALITVIGGKELLYAAKAVGAKTYSVTYPYLGAAAMYLVLVIILTWLQGKLERRLRQSDRR